MVPIRARAPKGERALGKAPKNWEKNVTLISSISSEGMGPSMSIEGSADGEAYVVLYVLAFPVPEAKASWADSAHGQPAGTQDEKGEGVDREMQLLARVLAELFA